MTLPLEQIHSTKASQFYKRSPVPGCILCKPKKPTHGVDIMTDSDLSRVVEPATPRITPPSPRERQLDHNQEQVNSMLQEIPEIPRRELSQEELQMVRENRAKHFANSFSFVNMESSQPSTAAETSQTIAEVMGRTSTENSDDIDAALESVLSVPSYPNSRAASMSVIPRLGPNSQVQAGYNGWETPTSEEEREAVERYKTIFAGSKDTGR